MGEFGKAIRTIRINRGMSLRTFAKNLNYSAPYLSDLENGNRKLSLEVINKLKEKLILSEEEYIMLSDEYGKAHSSLPLDVVEYINNNDLINAFRILNSFDKNGKEIKKLVLSLSKKKNVE